MRCSLLPASVLALCICSLAACSSHDADLGPGGPPDGGGHPPIDAGLDAPIDSIPADTGPCDADLTFQSDVHRLARGGSVVIPAFGSSPLLLWQIGVVDPTIVSARAVDFGLQIDALAPGSTSIIALHCGRAVRYDVTVVSVANLEVRLTQSFGGRTDPTTQITALAGSTDVLEITYLDGDGGVLGGQGAATYLFDRGVSLGDHPTAQLQQGQGGSIPRDFPVFSFAAAGRIFAKGDFGTIPIDVTVVPQPDTIAIASFSFSIFYGAAVVGQTASGTPLAGVTASWDIAPKTGFVISPPVTGTRDILFYADLDGTPFVPPTVTAHVGALTASKTITSDEM